MKWPESGQLKEFAKTISDGFIAAAEATKKLCNNNLRIARRTRLGRQSLARPKNSKLGRAAYPMRPKGLLA